MVKVSGVAAALVVPWLLLSPASDSGTGSLSWAGTTIDGRSLTALAGDPLEVSSDEPAVVELSVENTGSEPVRVSEVTLTGHVMGMVFFDYATGIDAEVLGGEELARTVEIELVDLAGQGVGRVPATVALVGEDGEVLDERSLAVHVEGSLLSAYGIFGLAIAASTAVLLVSLLIAVSRGMLPENRWRRALHFLPVGTGLGLTLTFTLSAAALLTPSGQWWATFVVGFSAAAFALGYFLPLPAVVQQQSRASGTPV